MRRPAVQIYQQVRRHQVERRLVLTIGEQPGKGGITKILEQKKPGSRILGQNPGCAVAKSNQVTSQHHKGPHILHGWWRIHQDRAAVTNADAVIAPEGCVGGQKGPVGSAPAGYIQKRRDLIISVSHSTHRF